jgi:hypothetical protein
MEVRKTMDDSRFDAWTRRRVGLAGGVLAASLLGMASGPISAGNKKKHKKKKKKEKHCVPAGKICAPSSPNCCDSTTCVWIPEKGSYVCV